MHFTTLILSAMAASAAVAQLQVRPYSCLNNENICSNICYWQICVHPEQTFYTRDSTGPVDQRRIDCGATHTPPACPDTGGLGIGDDTNSSPDEFPFASLSQGGRTPYGDGASILCVTVAEQRSQGGKVRQLYNGVAQGEDFELALQDTNGIQYCDPSSTPVDPLCDGTRFNGVHFFPDDDVFCQWNIETSGTVRCIDGQTGDDVDPPAAVRLKARERMEQPRAANFTALLHVREPEMVKLIPNPERDETLMRRERMATSGLGRRVV
ncbi:hypothetical protein QBC34DRAFT_100624 [Podospora aff. communis PSN243]|uniref:Deoxyribonuclease NucA/NucB domain-containing protein n=1 Tax=Podospora aff. communis PSN243 TaxID=3040156 RepID=A0AAV9GL13_9PEZI|nr:hypothetical protein QBC34DRAFT_100624 [Podospora aff. communis PSN243]